MFCASFAEIVHLLADGAREIKGLRKILQPVPLVVTVEMLCNVKEATSRDFQGFFVWIHENRTLKTASSYEAERLLLSLVSDVGVGILEAYGYFAVELQHRHQLVEHLSK